MRGKKKKKKKNLWTLTTLGRVVWKMGEKLLLRNSREGIEISKRRARLFRLELRVAGSSLDSSSLHNNHNHNNHDGDDDYDGQSAAPSHHS